MAAQRRAGRVAVVREVTGLAAYRTGAVRRGAGRAEDGQAAVRIGPRAAADRRRGAGPGPAGAGAGARLRPEARRLSTAERVEMMIVVSGARRDLGQLEAAVVALQPLSSSRSALPGGLAWPMPTPTHWTPRGARRRPAAGSSARRRSTWTAPPTRPSVWPSWDGHRGRSGSRPGGGRPLLSCPQPTESVPPGPQGGTLSVGCGQLRRGRPPPGRDPLRPRSACHSARRSAASVAPSTSTAAVRSEKTSRGLLRAPRRVA